MLTPEEIHRFAENKYRDFLRSVAAGTSLFPLEVARFGRAKTREGPKLVTAQVERLHAGAKKPGGAGYTVESKDSFSHNLGSRQFLPERVYFSSEQDYLDFLGKAQEVDRFRVCLETTRQVCPELVGWIPSNAMLVVKHADRWDGLLAVCAYYMRHPRPNLYARELPVPVHTKFIEENEAILARLLEHLLPSHLNPDAEDFYSRFFLRDTEPFVELRILGPTVGKTLGSDLPHMKLPVGSLASLGNGLGRFDCIISENRLPFLTLPDFPNAVAFFGQGNAVGLLRHAPWLADCPHLLYWGDIDSRGFQMLAGLRAVFPRVQSILMDRATFDLFPQFHVEYSPKSTVGASLLTDVEEEARALSVSKRRRLEQERLPLDFAHLALRRQLIER